MCWNAIDTGATLVPTSGHNTPGSRTGTQVLRTSRSCNSSSYLYIATNFTRGEILTNQEGKRGKRAHQEKAGSWHKKVNKKSFSHHASCRCSRKCGGKSDAAESDCTCAVPAISLAMTHVIALCPFQRSRPLPRCHGFSDSLTQPRPHLSCRGQGGDLRGVGAFKSKVGSISTLYVVQSW